MNYLFIVLGGLVVFFLFILILFILGSTYLNIHGKKPKIFGLIIKVAIMFLIILGFYAGLWKFYNWYQL